MLITILALVALAVVAFVIIVAMRPSEFRVARSATILAPPEVVFAEVNDLRRYNAWAPWSKMDPDARQVFDGPPTGVGAALAWVGKKIGEGRMTLVESQPSERIRFRLEFLKPFAATNTAEFMFQPETGGDRTLVTWSMFGRNSSFLCKAMSLFMDCDKMVGGEFEKGLADLKTIAEAKTERALAAAER